MTNINPSKMEFDMKTLNQKHKNSLVNEIEKMNITGCYRSIEEHYIQTGRFPGIRDISTCNYEINGPKYTDCNAFQSGYNPTYLKGVYISCSKEKWSAHVTHEYFKKI